MNVFIVQSAAPTINGIPIQPGDEIAVFDSLGQCFGHTIWNANAAAIITVWGYSSGYGSLPDKKGFRAGATLHFRIWDASASREALATATYDLSTPPFLDTTYVYNGLCKLGSLTGTYNAVRSATPVSPATRSLSLQGSDLVYTLARPAPVRIDLFDPRGRCLFSVNRVDGSGIHRLALRERSLPAGCCIARFSAGSEQAELPIVIER